MHLAEIRSFRRPICFVIYLNVVLEVVMYAPDLLSSSNYCASIMRGMHKNLAAIGSFNPSGFLRGESGLGVIVRMYCIVQRNNSMHIILLFYSTSSRSCGSVGR